MLELTELKMPVDDPPEALRAAVAEALQIPDSGVLSLTVSKRAIDARRGRVRLSYMLLVSVRDEAAALTNHRREIARVSAWEEKTWSPPYVATAPPPPPAQRPVIAGTGPCGLFCALLLARAGWKPIDRK